MTKKAIIFDLDDTLIPDHGAVEEAVLATCGRARERVDPAALAESVWRQARALWRAGPMIDHCQDLGLASWEGLQGTFEGDEPKLTELRKWVMSSYRSVVWTSALAEHGVRDEGLVEELSAAFPEERRARYVPYKDVVAALDDLRQDHALAMLTNGIPDIQREKLEVSGLSRYFEVTLISGDVGIGKPDPRLFHSVLADLEARPEEAVMVGNSPRRDVAGAQAAGVLAVQIERGAPERAEGVTPDALIRDLGELRGVIEQGLK